MSIPSDKPTSSGGLDTSVIIIENVQSSSFVHISQEVEEVGQGEVGSREGDQEEARCQDSEEACVAATPALHTLAKCLCRSSSEVVEAHVEEQLRLLGDEDDMEARH